MKYKNLVIVIILVFGVVILYLSVFDIVPSSAVIPSDTSAYSPKYVEPKTDMSVKLGISPKDDTLTSEEMVWQQYAGVEGSSRRKQGTSENTTNIKEDGLDGLCSMAIRLNHVEEACKRHGLFQWDEVDTVPIKDLPDLLVDDKHQVMHCGFTKAASTMWIRYLAQASGRVKSWDVQ